MELLIATKNTGKVKEIEKLLSNLPVTLKSLNDFPHIPEPEETGSTFAENAVLKARYYALQTNLPALADDSGLEIKALNNAPGIFSARYAGENASQSEKIEKILAEIEQVESDNRQARFVCSVAISDQNGAISFSADGTCNGKISLEPRGNNGFGYDPVFIPDGFSETFGELSDNVKQQISHRAQAIQKIIAYLQSFLTV